MKKNIYILSILVFIGIFLVFSNCKKENIQNPTKSSSILTEGFYINSNAIKNTIPNSYKNNKYVVFLNQKNEKSVFKIFNKEEKINAKLNNITYFYDEANFELQSEVDENFIISLQTGAAFEDDTKYSMSLNLLFSPKIIDNRTNLVITMNQDGSIKDQEKLSGYKASVTLNGKIFKDLFISPKWNNQTISSYVYYNKEFGVVAFQEANKDLFIFDHFE